MPVPTHFRFSFRGHFTGTPEFWNFGCHFGRTVAGGPDAHLSDIDEAAVTSALDTFMANAFFSTVTVADDWRAYDIGTDGRTQSTPLRVDLSAVSGMNGAGGMNHPTSTAVVASLRGTVRGPAQRGRMYLPCLAAPMSTGGQLSATDALAIATATTNFLKGISDAIDLPLDLGSAPGINVSDRGGPAGKTQEIDHVEVGRQFDHLQSRRRNLVEDYQAAGHIDW